MRRVIVLGVAGALLVASGAFAATVIGGADRDAASTGPPIQVEMKRIGAAQAHAAGAPALASAKKPKKPKISYFFAAEPVEVPDNDTYPTLNATPDIQGSCPGKRKVLAGFWDTNNFIYASDSVPISKKTWQWAFVDTRGEGPALATPGIVCAKGVK